MLITITAQSIIAALAITAANAFTIHSSLSTNSFTSARSTSTAATTPAASSIAPLTMAAPQPGDVVTVNYTLKPDGDFVPNPLFDDGTVSFILDGGNYLPALHTIVAKLSPGETQSCTMDAGYGEPREELIATISIASSGISKNELSVGRELFLANGMKCTIVDVDLDKEETFTIDANHKLAGTTYSAEVELKGFESGPSLWQFVYTPEAVPGSKFDVLTIALGCFWGGELAYMRVPGVVGSYVGYTQGPKDDPTYEEVCSGTSGHTEAIQVIFDTSKVSYEELVKIGMEKLGDSRPLVNQVGNDQGTQYRHGVYYHNFEQMLLAKSVIESYAGCVTECMEASKFYKAEEYHQQYLLKGGQSARKNAQETIRCYG
jgi:peptide-methionine (S)-S-oxide reductase